MTNTNQDQMEEEPKVSRPLTYFELERKRVAVLKDLILALLFLMLFAVAFISQAQDRTGSIDLTENHGREIYFNNNNSENGVGIEDGPFTIEAWVYPLNTTDDDFVFFRLQHGQVKVSLHYRGDDRKSNYPWVLEMENTPEHNQKGYDLDYNAPNFEAPDIQEGWHHIAFTAGSARIRLYIDGVLALDQTLTKNNIQLESIFPSDPNGVDGDCTIGGTSLINNKEGKFYVGEIRVWKDRITDEQMTQYYDEEVNASHIKWDKLVRYYHGYYSESNDPANNRIFRDMSPTNTFDGYGSHSDVVVEPGFTPRVKPGAFNNNIIGTTFTAQTCAPAAGISLSWTDFRNLPEYEVRTLVNYEIRRERDDKLIYLGSNNYAVDTDVSLGDVEQYALRAYWLVNGSDELSDDVMLSNTGSVTTEWLAPTGVSATTNLCNNIIDLSWDAPASPPGLWEIRRSEFSDFADGGVTIEDALSGSLTSYSDVSGKIAEQMYYYKLIPKGTDANSCDAISNESEIFSGIAYASPAAPDFVSISVNAENTGFEITWQDAANSLADGFILTREKVDGSDPVDIPFDITETTHTDTDVNICESYRYLIGTTNACVTDGVFSTNSITKTLSQDLDEYISSFSASKGYFGNAVRLEWEINGSLSQIDRFLIYRSIAEPNANYSLIKVLDNDLIYDDETAVSGIFYNYRIIGETQCNTSTTYTNEMTQLGFRQSFGVASGVVQYAGGNAVEGVSINFERQDGETLGKSLIFDGDGDYVAIDGFTYNGSQSEATIETWIKTTKSGDQVIASYDASEYWRMEINGTSAGDGRLGILFQENNGDLSNYEYSTIQSTNRIDDGSWHHVAGVYNNGVISLYIDGELDNQITASTTKFGEDGGEERYGFIGVGSESPSFNGITGPSAYFQGNLDEFRIWSRALTEDEIKKNYNRFLSNEQSSLELYYRFDEGTGNHVFDASKKGEIFNKNDGTFSGNVSFSNDIPSVDQLGIRGITDEFGLFTMDYIPYAGSGDVFRVTPAFGQHAFEPSSKSLYLGDGASVQNDVDFTDISSFTVNGKVTYENSEVPVEGVAIYIDGIQAVDASNQAVRTDSDGNYTVDVPIGDHFLSAHKDKHTFSEGVFPPLDEFGTVLKYEFTEDLTVDFIDNTKITVAGRVVGGGIQAQFPLGFDLSTNNVGVSTVELQLVLEGYDIDVTDDAVYNTVSVATDEYSGEFSMELIPEKWVVTQAGNDRYAADPGDLVDLSGSLDVIVSTYEEEVIGGTVNHTYEYNHDLSFIIQSQPIIEVLDANGEELHGEDQYIITDPDTGTDIVIDLGESSPFLHDIYQGTNYYDVEVFVYEIYENAVHPDGAIIDKVPVEKAEITITDNLRMEPGASIGETNESGLFEYTFQAGIPSFQIDGDNSYTKTFEVEASVNDVGITWSQDEVYRAYVLGPKPEEGTDFITYGPDRIDVVLRDPPGSNSYAYIEQGSSFSSSETWEFNQATAQGMDVNWYTGFLAQAGGGLAGPVVKNETISHSEIGATIERYIDYDGKFGRTVTFNERIETSSDPEDVGSMADLYIGRSFNAFVQETKNLEVLRKDYCDLHGLTYFGDGEYVLGQINGFTMDDGNTETYFIYSQRHILEELIPDLMILRNDLMTSGKYESVLDITHPCWGMSNDSECLSQYFTDDELDNVNQSYNYVGPSDEMDSVDFINDNITVWLNAIATNEAEKASANTQTNLSIDGSTGAYSSTLTEEFSGEYNWNSSRKINIKWNGNFTNVTNNAGTGIETTTTLDLNFGSGGEETQDRSMEFGYVIDERDEGDYYSIDIKKQDGVPIFDASDFVDNIPSKDEFIVDQLARVGYAGAVTAGILYVNQRAIGKGVSDLLGKSKNANVWLASLQFTTNLAVWTYEMVDMGINVTETIDEANGAIKTGIGGFSIGGPIFSVRGGQTRCPYEPAEYSSFFTKNGNLPLLHTATLAREVPTISATPAIRSNVPVTEVATFNLALGNESESESDIWYELSIDESSNPDGAVLLVDGVSAERSFLVPANGIINKTLTIAPGSTGVLDYENIGIVLHSACQANPESAVQVLADTVFITAKFLPTCSDVEITNMSEDWVINYGDNGSVPITIGGYDINSSTLEKISFHYLTAGGIPVTVEEIQKADLPGGEVTINWDVSDLTDRAYQIYAKSTCTDLSETESTYLSGILDTSNPQVFGNPEPVDGIYDAGDDIKIRFSETLLADLVRYNNIEVRSVLNGADVRHATSLQFDGMDDEMTMQNVSFNGKSFTIEYWAKHEVYDPSEKTTIFKHGANSNKVVISQLGTDLTFQLGQQSDLTVSLLDQAFDDSWDGWHHWAFIYNATDGSMIIYMDDKVLGNLTGVTFNPAYMGELIIGQNQYQGKMHELRIWEDARSYTEVLANMSTTLTGNEPGMYGYWPMDEGTGELVIDKTSSRNAATNASWSLEPGGVSWEFAESNYLTIDSRNVAIDEETDLTIEFWFKGTGSATTQTLLSNGHGDGSDPVKDPGSVMAIEARPDGTIHVMSNGHDFQGTSENFMDDQWHHLAFVLDRSTHARLYIDGALQNQDDASLFSGLSGAELTLGARIHDSGITVIDDDPSDGDDSIYPITYDNYFTGLIDEVRFWNTSRSSLMVETYMHTKLEGDEVGLVAYTAFETYDILGAGSYVLQNSLADLATDEDLSDTNDAISGDGIDRYSSQRPPVKDVRGLQEITNIQYVVNGDEIIITPNIDYNRIEGQVLEISVKDVQDLNGNRLLSPVIWTAFVQQNQIKWDERTIELTKKVDEELVISTSFTNNSGTAYSYTLENIPSWLSTDQASGVVNPQQTIEVHFEVNGGLNVGSYEHGINLTTDLAFDEKLTINLRVAGDEPDWIVDDSQFDYSMNVFGRLIIEGEVSTDEYDMVAAFVNDEIRGVVKPTYVDGVDQYQVFLTIYSNNTSEENVELRVFDASTGNTHENVTPSISFVANNILGSVLNPIDIEADDRISMQISLNEGWTWISFNLDDTNLASVEATLAGIGADGDIVKNQSTFDEYSGGSWFGTLTNGGGFRVGDMYKVKLTEASTLKVLGTPSDVFSTSLTISSGWNYVGFVPQVQMTLAETLVSYNPEVGDVIKTSNQFAMYAGTDLGWVGSLSSMQPGQGHMLYAIGSGTLTYPERSSLSGSRTADEISYDHLFTVIENEAGHTMSVIAQVSGMESLDQGQDWLLVAYAEGQVKGYVSTTELGEASSLFFISVSAQESESLTFKLYDASADIFYDLDGDLSYHADQIEGSINYPVELRLNTVLGIEETHSVQVYPNPFDNYVEVVIMAKELHVNVSLIDMSGRIIFSEDIGNTTSGEIQLRLDDEIAAIKSGMYLLQVIEGSDKTILKLKK